MKVDNSYLTNFIRSIKSLGYSENTIKAYLQDLEYLTDKDLSISVVEDYINKYYPSTRNRKLSTIRKLISFIEDNYSELASPEIKLIKKLRFSKVQRKVLRLPDIDLSNISKIKNKKHYLILKTLIETGIRASEVCSIRKKDCFFEDYPYLIISGKGNKERIVPITDSLKKELEEYTSSIASGFIFLSRNNKKLLNISINKLCRRYLNINTHMLRHLFCSKLLEAGANIFDVKELAGHSDIKTTEIYLHHLNKDRIKEILEKTFG